MCNEAKKLKKFIMKVPKCGVEPAGWEVTFYNGGSGNQEGESEGTVTKATAKTYDFAGLSATDFTDSTGTAVSKWGNNVSWASSITVNLPAGNTIVSGATAYCKEQTDSTKQTLIRARTGEDSKTTALNFNGGASSDFASGTTISDLDRYVSIPVDGAGTISVSIKAVNSSQKKRTLQFGLFDAEGKLLGSLVTADVTTGKITGTEKTTATITGTVTTATTVYLACSRNGASGGGMDVYSITVTPAE